MTTPTPVLSPTPTEEPIDPTDVVTVNTGAPGPDISLHDSQEQGTVNCKAYNRVVLNAFDKKLTIKGGCRQVMINGDRNTIALEAVTEIVINGHQNNISYEKLVNGKKPVATDNGRENVIEKASKDLENQPAGS